MNILMNDRKRILQLRLAGYAAATLIWLAGLTLILKLWPSLLGHIVSIHVPLLSQVLLPDHVVARGLIVYVSIVFSVYIALVLIGMWAAVAIGSRHNSD